MTYKIIFHPAVADDLDSIVSWIAEYAGWETAERKLSEIETAIFSLTKTPHKGTVRDDIAAGVRAIPAGRKAVIAFGVDDVKREVHIYAVTYAGSDWISRTSSRS